MTTATKKRWRVLVETGYLELGGLGRCPMQEALRIDAADADEARAMAKEEKPDARIRRVEEIGTWAITLRGRHDKRRRETFLVEATDEESAGQNLASNLAACRFSRVYSRKDREQSVVKIERKEPAPVA